MRSRDRRGRTDRGDDALIDELFGSSNEGPRHQGAERREKQLCREVFRVLAETVTCAEIVEIRPAPDTARLAVGIRIWSGDAPEEVLERLLRDKGRLRAEIARTLQRKRTPDLFFEVLP